MRLVDYSKLSKYLGVPVGTLYAWVHEGRLPYMRLSGRTVRFDLDQIDAWLAERREGVANEQLDSVRATERR